MRLSRPLSLAILLVLVTGCSVAPVATTTKSGSGSPPAPIPTPAGAAVKGVVFGGQQPITGAQIYLLAVSTSGSGQPSSSLMKQVAGDTSNTNGVNGWYYVTTGDGTSSPKGNFSIKAADYSCTTGQQVYLYSLGGNPQVAGTNINAGLIALLGTCTAPGTFSGLPATVQMNEVTTVAAANALAGFANDATDISGPSSATNYIANAVASARNLVNLGTGLPWTTTPGGNGTVPSDEIISLANILGACVNSQNAVASGPPPAGSACDTLFSNATSNGKTGGTQPTDTAGAAINIAHNPGANVHTLYQMITSFGSSAFIGGLSAEPNDFTVAVTYTGGGLSRPFSIAVDGSGNVWTANSTGNSLSEFNTVGSAVSASSGDTGGGLSDPVSLAFDPSGHIWVANKGNGTGNSISEFSSSGTAISTSSGDTGGGLNCPDAVAVDGSGNVWVANCAGSPNIISEFNSSGSPISPSGYSGGGLNGPVAIATDALGNAWAVNQTSNSISAFNSSGTALSGASGFQGGGMSLPAGIAIDASGNVWAADAGNGRLSEFSSAGAALSGSGYTGGGLNGPAAIAIDGSGSAWAANNANNTISRFDSTGAAISGSSGYAASGLNQPQAIAVDGSGNVWVANAGGDSITEFVGAASPVASTPLATQPFNLVIGTSSLPTGTVGTAYSATLQAGGGTSPYSWAQTGGLALSTWNLTLASNGTISGTPEATAAAVPLTFTVTDAKNAQQSVTLNLTINGNPMVTVTAISPQNGGITIHQTLPVSATTSDGTNVTWSATAGTFSSSSSASGVAVTYTPPATAGAYTITATSNSSGATLSGRVGVTDLTGVWTYHNNNYRDGANTHEYALTPTNVASDFGLLFRCAVDSPIYTQPLWVPNLTINGAAHNVVFVATTNDTLYAFDADAAPCTTLWSLSMLGASELPVPSGTSGHLVGNGNGDIQPKTGVIGTPVIDLSTNTLYVVSKSYKTGPQTFFQRLHAVDLTSGAEKFNGPVALDSTHIPYSQCSGTGCTPPAFDQKQENQRCALALANGTVYVSWAGHEDAGTYYGWIAGFNAGDLSQTPTVFNDAPDAEASGIWLSGGAPAIDDSGNLYLTTGNGTLDAYSGTTPNDDYGNAALKLSAGLAVVSSFASPAHGTGFSADLDLGAGGITIVPNGTNPPLLINGGKDNYLYVLNSSNLGGYNDAAAQEINLGDQIFGTGAFWNSTYYLGTQDHVLQAFTLSSGTLNTTSIATQNLFKFPGTSPSVSSAASDTTTGILWAQDNSSYCTKNTPNGCGPAVLYAYTATSLGKAIWNSGKTGANAAGNAMKFTVPTVANGKVYVSTRGTTANGGTANDSTVGELDVYGLLQ